MVFGIESQIVLYFKVVVVTAGEDFQAVDRRKHSTPLLRTVKSFTVVEFGLQ